MSSVPPAHTNLIERAFRELRRRLRPIGSLTDRRSADRILYGQVLRLNELLANRPLAAFTQESWRHQVSSAATGIGSDGIT